MSKPFALQAVLELTQRRTDDAAQELAGLIAAEESSREKLNLLLQYREEYSGRLQAATQEGLSPQQWKNYLDFISRLDEAIEQQQKALEEAQKNTARGQARWQEQRVRLKAIDTLAVRHQQNETLRENRREQKLVDEFAARSSTRRRDGD